MKPRHLALVLPLCFLIPVLGTEKNLQSHYELIRAIDGTLVAGQRGRLVVPGTVFGQARSFPNDLRIFAADGTQWPFFLHVPKETTEIRKLEPEILNRAWVAGDEPYLQFDLAVPAVDGAVPVHNRMELATSGRDFVRRVEIFTGDPAQPAGHVASGYLIDFSRQRNAQNRTIRYPDSDAARLQVRIYPNAQAADERFDIATARLHYRAVAEVERERVDFQRLDVPEREQEKDATTQLFDLGEENRPVEFITFEVGNESYARCVSIYGRNTEHEPWRWVGGGEIHVLSGDQENTVKLAARDRFLKVHVFHYDDLPLTINGIKLEAVPRYLVFEAATDGGAALCFRAWDSKAPRYDLKGRIATEILPTLPVFQTLETKPNESARAQPWRKYSRLLGGLAVAAVSLLVIWIIASMLRQQRAEEK
jgi:hypothetical protein